MMPKYGIHTIVLDETIKLLESSLEASANDAAELLKKHRFCANLGAIGPDMFFFAEDYAVMQRANAFLPVLEFGEELYETYEKVTEPIRRVERAVGQKVNETFDTLGLGVVTEIVERIESIEVLLNELKGKTITAGVLAGVNPLHTDTNQHGIAHNPFSRIVRELYENFLIPPNQNNYEEVDWYWFDMLHYRNVGDFAHNLVRNAKSEQQRAYALAYLTHIATDVVGHPYVNQIVGGSFRLAVQRHVTVENYMDVYQYHAHYGKVVSQTLYEDLEFADQNHEELPDDIAKLLVTAFRETFAKVAHPRLLGSPSMATLPTGPLDPNDDFGFLTVAQIKDCYGWLRRAVKMLGGQDDIKPKPPRSIRDTIDQDLAEIIDAINDIEPPPPPPSFFPDTANAAASFAALFSGDVTLEEIADAVAETGGSLADWMDEWTGYMGEAIQYSLETAVQLLKVARGIVQMSANMTAHPLLVALYGIQWALYEMIKGCKRIIALNGLTYPDVDSIDDNLSKSLMFIFDENRHYIPGVEDKRRRGFPKLRAKGQVHLIAPIYADECQTTTPAFHVPGHREPTPDDFTPDGRYRENMAILEPVTPRSFIQDEPFNVDALKSYAAAATPQETREAQESAIGNAVEFSAWLIKNANNPNLQPDERALVYTNWNLDGDRGYGAKSWVGLAPNNWDSSVNEKLCIALAADNGEPADLINLTAPHAGYPILDPGSGIIVFEDGMTTLQTDCKADDDDTDYVYAKIKAKGERYADMRTWADLQSANLVVAESNVPTIFTTFSTKDAHAWSSILAPRLAVDGAGRRQNLYHINGIGTPLYNGLYERYNVEHFFKEHPDDDVRVKLLYNFTDNRYPLIWWKGKNSWLNMQKDIDESLKGEMLAVSDGLQAITDKIWSYRALFRNFSFNTLNDLTSQVNNNGLNFANVSNTLLPTIGNATTIAVIAVLYDALKQGKDGKDIGFVGYSHGTQIIFNGILAFAFQGAKERTFLKNRVRVFYTGRMVDELSVTLLGNLVNDFDQLALPGDPVSMSLGNIPPTTDFLKGLSQTQIQIGLEETSVQNALVNFLAARSDEQHKFYLYAPKIKAENHQAFF
jgi:hypothetical protein